MNDAEFQIYEAIEDTHWWFVGKRFILQALLEGDAPPTRIIDLGCGSGGVLASLAGRAACVGVDTSAYALGVCRTRGMSQLVRANLTAVPFRPACFDVVMALDVLEHVDDDVGLLRQMASVCRRGGRILVSVPAYMFLWSQHDVTFGHKRRYRAAMLEQAVRAAGLVPERVTYTNFFVFPIAAAWRTLSRSRRIQRLAPPHDFIRLPRPVNAAIALLYRAEAKLLRRINLPMGVSVACVARRP